MLKEDIIKMLDHIRLTCFDNEGEEINSETLTVIDNYCDIIEKGK